MSWHGGKHASLRNKGGIYTICQSSSSFPRATVCVVVPGGGCRGIIVAVVSVPFT